MKTGAWALKRYPNDPEKRRIYTYTEQHREKKFCKYAYELALRMMSQTNMKKFSFLDVLESFIV
jgi:hypothetical protein